MENMELREIHGEEEVALIYKEIRGQGQILPFFLYHDDLYDPIALNFFENGKSEGIILAIQDRSDGVCYLHYLQIKKNCAKSSSIMFMVNGFIHFIKEKKGVRELVVFDAGAEKEKCFAVKLFERAQGITIKEINYIRQIKFSTEKINEWKKLHLCRPQVLEKKGCYILPWKEVPEKQLEKIYEEEEKQLTDEDYLSPFITEKDITYDEKTSFALMKKGIDEPLGWIICIKENNEMVWLRRFYIHDKYRGLQAGGTFLVNVLDTMQKYYKNIQYEVVLGNRQMEKLTEHYCKKAILSERVRCIIKMQINE